MSQRHPQAESLPHHSAERAIRAADDLVGSEEQAGADRIGVGRNQRRAALETGERVLFDRQRMQLCSQAMCLFFPLGLRRELRGEVGFPEGDVTDAADAEDDRQLSSIRGVL